jgi:ketosteroid isomerase-like protein
MPTGADIVRGIYDAFGAGDFAKALQNVSPNVIWRELIPYQGTFTSHDEIVYLFEKVVEEFDWQMDFRHFVDGGDIVVVLGTYTWVKRPAAPDEPRTSVHMAHAWWLEDGLVTRYEQFADTLKAISIIQPKPIRPKS